MSSLTRIVVKNSFFNIQKMQRGVPSTLHASVTEEHRVVTLAEASMWTRAVLCCLLLLSGGSLGGGRVNADAALVTFTPTSAFPNRCACFLPPFFIFPQLFPLPSPIPSPTARLSALECVNSVAVHAATHAVSPSTALSRPPDSPQVRA